MTSPHFTLYKTTMVLPLHQQGLASYVVKDSTSWQPIHMTISTKHCKNKGKIHDIHTRHIVQNMSSKENMCIEENKNNCHNYKAYTTKFQQKNKKYKDKGTLDTSHIALLRSTLDTRSFSKKPACLTAFWKHFSCFSMILLVQKQLFLKLPTSLFSWAAHSSDSSSLDFDSVSRASKLAITWQAHPS